MKRIIITATAVMLCAAAGHAQSVYEGAKFTDRDLSGTARFVGMGGALGALGGDISTIATNPAGIGIYRSNDIMTSFGFSAYGTETQYGNGAKLNNDKTQGSFNNIGAVFSTKIGNYSALRYVNFGFNYKRAVSFYNNTRMEGYLNQVPVGGATSQTYQMAAQAYGASGDMLGSEYAFMNEHLDWLSPFGFQGWLINPDAEVNNMYNSVLYGTGVTPYANFYSEERGGIDQYDFNVAFNFNDRFYLGFTIGAYDVNYHKYSYYSEGFENAPYDPEKGSTNGYALKTWNDVSGAGFDFKMGAIFRPFEYSPLRVGMAIHTPVFYKLTSERSAEMTSDFFNNEGERKFIEISTYDDLGGRVDAQENSMRTPWKYNLSLGYTIGKELALGAEYEYQDYSTIRYNDSDGYSMDFEKNEAKLVLKGVNTLRVGAEYKVIPQFAIRLGYNYTSSAFKADAQKFLSSVSPITDTDYTNVQSKNDYTLGIGYRGDMFYADLAYKYTSVKGDFYAFADPDNWLDKTKLTNTRSQVLLTLGMRF